MSNGTDSELLEALSERLLQHLPRDVWRHLYCGATRPEIDFQASELFAVHAESGLLQGARRTEHFRGVQAWLAACHGGRVQPAGRSGCLVTFEQPLGALRLALSLQRMCPELRLHIGIAGGAGTTASFAAGGTDHCVAFGEVIERAESAARVAGSGSIVMSSEAYDALHDAIDPEIRGCVLVEEFDESTLSRAAITVPPAGAESPSSFAGLGLT